jgi:hypothetical protein
MLTESTAIEGRILCYGAAGTAVESLNRKLCSGVLRYSMELTLEIFVVRCSIKSHTEGYLLLLPTTPDYDDLIRMTSHPYLQEVTNLLEHLSIFHNI